MDTRHYDEPEFLVVLSLVVVAAFYLVWMQFFRILRGGNYVVRCAQRSLRARLPFGNTARDLKKADA
jgi:hypothetical protein